MSTKKVVKEKWTIFLRKKNFYYYDCRKFVILSVAAFSLSNIYGISNYAYDDVI